MLKREQTKKINVGGVIIGGNKVPVIQSMTNTKTEDIDATVRQINDLKNAGCQIVRCTANTDEAANAFKELKKRCDIPLVADIHFDYKFAIKAMEAGADKIRINPGNIGGTRNIKEVVQCAKEKNIPIRVGVNSGSLEKEILSKYSGVNAEGLCESAMDKIHIIQDLGYDNLVVSIKSSDVNLSIKAHEMIAEMIDYPLHIGITESGTIYSGSIKSAVGLGVILNQGIGDTIRVSLTGDPVKEIDCAKIILRSLGLYKKGINIISCPTCGRTEIDLISLASNVEELTKDYDLDLNVAVMGCVVNGPGEAKEADIGIAGGKGKGILIKKGEIIKTVDEGQLLNALKEELDNWK